MNAVTTRPAATDDHPVRRWLGALAPLVAPAYPQDAAEAFRTFAPLLAAYPAEAFNRRTLEDAACCARSRTGIPTYAELRDVIAAWLRDRQPVRQALPPPPDVVPPDERVTPEQADAILAKHGASARTVPAALDERRRVRASYLTGEALAEARRRAGYGKPE